MSEAMIKQSVKRAIAKNKKRYNSTFQFLKKKKLNKSSGIILIGPEKSGKTSLLKNAELAFAFEKKIADPNNIQPTTTYDWWVTKQTIYIDSPGRLFDSNNKIAQKSRDHLLRFIKKHGHKNAVSGIVLTLGIDHLLALNSAQKLDTLLQNIHINLSEIYKKFKNHPPIHIAINKCDLMTGFREFFGELSRDERQQYWGVLFNSKTDVISSFSEGFDRLINRLNQQLIWRLQHEYNTDKKALINDFPLQMKQTKTKLTEFFSKWQNVLGSKFNLKSICFTAATQKPIKNQATLNQESNGSQLINIQQPVNSAYFLHDFFQNRLLDNIGGESCQPNQWKIKSFLKLFLVLAASGTIVFFAFFWTYSFKKQVNHINAAQQAITTYHVLSQENLSDKNSFSARLQSLQSLQKAVAAFNINHSPILSKLTLNQSMLKLQQKTILVYQNALRKFVIPKIRLTLINLLKDNNTPADIQYAGLKSYIMLSQPKHYDANQIKPLLQKVWQFKYPGEKTAAISSFLNDLFNQGNINIRSNMAMIKKARKHLLQLPTKDLANVIFQNMITKNEPLSLNLENNIAAASVLTFANPNIHINSIYTLSGYQSINPNVFQKAAFDAVHGNWVLGKTQTSSKTAAHDVMNSLKSQYLVEYANSWLAFLNNIKIVNFTQLNQLDQAVSLLSSDNSLLLQLANLIENNIVMDAFSNNNQLSSLAYIVQNTSQNGNSFQAIISTLKQLNSEMSEITTSNDPSKQAFILAEYRMRNNGSNDAIEKLFTMSSVYPEPIKSWLYTIASNAWQIILFQTQQYINTQWQKDIIPQYDAQLANRYPFQIMASQNATLESFAYFFEPNGLLDRFFTTNLAPFINKTQLPWTVKNVDSNSLQISLETLKNLQNIYTIQHAYFRNNDQHLYLPFSIQPKNLSAKIISLKFTLGQQSFTYLNQTPYQQNDFIWPDAFNSNLCQMVVTNTANQQTTIPCDGPWGLFKFLNQNNLQASKTPNIYTATLQQDDNTIALNLDTKQKQDPFSLAILSHFRLPMSIG